MPSNDERREVAARLREIAPGGDWPDMTAKACGLNPQLMSNSFHEFTGELCERLADLIEPEERTCCVELMDTGNEAAYEHYEYIAHCHSCHHEFGYVLYNEDGDTWQDELPNYCPNCGAKVVKQMGLYKPNGIPWEGKSAVVPMKAVEDMHKLNHNWNWIPLEDIERTCHDFGGEEGTNGEGYDFACDACGFCCDVCEPNYCPNCGAKVVE